MDIDNIADCLGDCKGMSRGWEKVRLVKQPEKRHSKTTWDLLCVLPSIRIVYLSPVFCY